MLDWAGFAMTQGEGRYLPSFLISPLVSRALPETENLRRVCLAHSLLGVGQFPGLAEEYIPPDVLATVENWTEVPIIVQAGSETLIFPVLLGVRTVARHYIEPGNWLLSDARQAAERAFLLAAPGRGFVLLRRASSASPLAGKSLGLPLAVAAARLARKKFFRPGLFMTGETDAAGNILPVDFVESKLRCARYTKICGLFIHPVGAGPFPGAVSARSFESALALADAYYLAFSAGDAFAENLDKWRTAPEKFFSWLASPEYQEEILKPLLEVIAIEGWPARLTGEKEIAHAAERLGNWLAGSGKACGNEILRSLLTFFPLEKARALPPSSRMRIAGLNITLLNHEGVTDSRWHKMSRECRASAAEEDLSSELDALLQYSREINSRHNAFIFHEKLSTEWLDRLDLFTRLYGKKRNTDQLGKIYGFLTQHAAFSEDYEKAKEYSRMSFDFFSRPEDKRRRLVDLAYIHCELNEPLRALQALRQAEGAFEEIASLDNVADPFLHAAFIRICLLRPEYFQDYPADKIFRSLAKAEHPWQGWACGCGRLALEKDRDFAQTCFEFALDMCEKKSASGAFSALRLLPLAAMWEAGLLAKEKASARASAALAQFRAQCEDNILSADHFRTLLESEDVLETLSIVEKNQKNLFPFYMR